MYNRNTAEQIQTCCGMHGLLSVLCVASCGSLIRCAGLLQEATAAAAEKLDVKLSASGFKKEHFSALDSYVSALQGMVAPRDGPSSSEEDSESDDASSESDGSGEDGSSEDEGEDSESGERSGEVSKGEEGGSAADVSRAEATSACGGSDQGTCQTGAGQDEESWGTEVDLGELKVTEDIAGRKDTCMQQEQNQRQEETDSKGVTTVPVTNTDP